MYECMGVDMEGLSVYILFTIIIVSVCIFFNMISFFSFCFFFFLSYIKGFLFKL